MGFIIVSSLYNVSEYCSSLWVSLLCLLFIMYLNIVSLCGFIVASSLYIVSEYCSSLWVSLLSLLFIMYLNFMMYLNIVDLESTSNLFIMF